MDGAAGNDQTCRNEGVQPVRIKVKEYLVGSDKLPTEIAEYFQKNGTKNPYASAYDGKVLEMESIELEATKKGEVSSSARPVEANAAKGKYPSASPDITAAELFESCQRQIPKIYPK